MKSHFGDKLANQNTEDDYEFDLVRGKGKALIVLLVALTSCLTTLIGKGLIVLLHGAPGVGKTSTAGEKVMMPYTTSLVCSRSL